MAARRWPAPDADIPAAIGPSRPRGGTGLRRDGLAYWSPDNRTTRARRGVVVVMAPENSETPLSAFKVLDHSSPEETHEIAVGLMNRHRMRLAAATTTFRANIHAAPVSGGLSMIYFSYGAPVEIDSAPLPDFAALHIPLQGRLDDHGREGRRVAGPGAAAFFSEHEAVHLRWSGDLQLLVLRIHRAALTRKLAALTGRRPSGPVVFAPEVGGPRHRALLSTVMTLQETVDEFAGRPAAVLAAELEEFVLSMLLLDHDHSHSDGIRGHIPSLPGRSMRAAVDFVADHFAEPITAATLARAAHVSERTLYEGFRARVRARAADLRAPVPPRAGAGGAHRLRAGRRRHGRRGRGEPRLRPPGPLRRQLPRALRRVPSETLRR